MKYRSLFLCAILSLVLPGAALAQCGPNGCPIPGAGGRSLPVVSGRQSRSAVSSNVQYGKAPESTCRLFNLQKRPIGSGTLVATGDGWGAVLTASHVFHAYREEGKDILVMFPSGKTYRGTLVADDRQGDLAIVKITPTPSEPVARIGNAIPQPNETVVAGGYGTDGRWRQITGRVLGYARQKSAAQNDSIIVSGVARPGDSGGPAWDESGRFVGVVSLTSEKFGNTVCVHVGRIYQFTNSPRFVFPWNARLADNMDARRFQVQQPVPQPGQMQQTPQTQSGPDYGPAISELNQRVRVVESDVAELQKIAEAAKQAAAKAETEAGKAFAEAVGVKAKVEEATGAADATAKKAEQLATAAAEKVHEIDTSLLTRIRTTVTGLLAKYVGWPAGIAGVIIGLVIWVIRKDILNKIEKGKPLIIEDAAAGLERLAARTPIKADDWIAGVVRRVADGIADRIEERFGSPSPAPSTGSSRRRK